MGVEVDIELEREEEGNEYDKPATDASLISVTKLPVN